MDIEFIANDPRHKARQKLDGVLKNGTDQIAIACAFCTAAGIQILAQHTALLGKKDSFVVVSAELPTDYLGLAALHKRIPSNLYVHWGSYLPVERKVGAALMHSKVFYARAGNECWLWTGSHNLTGNATQGGNCEAAILLHGTADEKPFQDALQHLEACRAEATLYDPDAVPPGKPDRTDLLVIHCEADAVPVEPFPWRAHLCLNTAEFDDWLGPPATVRLLLYPKGSLIGGWRSVDPIGAYSGSLTGQNLTARNPQANRLGTAAEWRAANFSIVEARNVLVLGPDSPPSASVTTQAVINITETADAGDILFSEEPRIERRMLEGERSLSTVDYDIRRFFRKDSVEGSHLVHVPYMGRRFVIRVPGEESRQRDLPRLHEFLAPDRDIPFDSIEDIQTPRGRRHPFIVKARYRVRHDG